MTKSNPPLDGPFAQPRPEMRGRYLIRSPAKAKAFALIDAVLRMVPQRSAAFPIAPKSILLADWGHLGDVVTTFGAIKLLREAFPAARIGMIVGSWGKAAIENTGYVDRLHVIDHWAVNRSNISFSEKLRRYRVTRRVALKEQREERYDAAIDFYANFPPAHPLFYRAGIPVRIGFETGGFGPLLTHAVAWDGVERPISERYRDLLAMALPTASVTSGDLRPAIPVGRYPASPASVDGRPYIVVHPGAGASYKDWGIHNWVTLVRQLAVQLPSHRLVVTGAGKAEVAMADMLVEACNDVSSYAGKASWNEFVALVAEASLVICPDTATGHVAAACGVPVISIFTGTTGTTLWAPHGGEAEVVTHPVLCAPCYRAGCEAMACVREVAVEQVVAIALKRLDRGGGERSDAPGPNSRLAT